MFAPSDFTGLAIGTIILAAIIGGWSATAGVLIVFGVAAALRGRRRGWLAIGVGVVLAAPLVAGAWLLLDR